ncbi:MAG: MFS transporter [Imperialibacter sp.]|uniref:MFS transporter n=1 Tax=Imperialibacter sp. TaxID=2038411 RepID=UPI0032ECBDFE
MKRREWANFPFHPGKWPFFYGWMILLWGSLGIVMSIPGQTMGVSVFTDSLLGSLHISRDELSFAYMLGTIGSSFMLPWAGRLYDRLGVRPTAVAAAVGLGLILVWLSNIDRLLSGWIATQATTAIVITLFATFLLLRFFGQGVLTIVSRNMMVQWFDQRRGFATGFSNVFVSLAFSISPLFLFTLIEAYTWEGAWLVMALLVGLAFPVVIIVFFRNRPEDSGLLPDGRSPGEGLAVSAKKKKKILFPVIKEFTAAEAIRNFPFWVFALMMAMQALYFTGFTFHVMSVFAEAGLPDTMAITIFQPVAIIAVVVTLVASSVSDHIPLKYLLYFKGGGACLGILGVIFLGTTSWGYYLIIIGNGFMTGMYAVLATVTWPRYYGRTHLGAISGQAMMMIVFGSALGPMLFSRSLSYFGTYNVSGWLCFAVYFTLTIMAYWADNPQKVLAERRG